MSVVFRGTVVKCWSLLTANHPASSFETHDERVPGKFPQGCSKRFQPSATWARRCRKLILQYSTISTVNHSRLPICLITTMPEQQMNKLCGKTPFPNGTVAMKTLASTNNFILARTVKLEVRSIDRLENVHRAAFEHGRHSQREKVCYRPTILKGLPCYPSTVAVKIHNW